MGPLTKDVLIFISISGIVLSSIAAIQFVDVDVKNSPIGIVKKVITQNGHTSSSWFINIGGGIQIPLYILVFGISGGYLRYLYDIWRDEPEPKEEKPKEQNSEHLPDAEGKENRRLFYKGVKNLALIIMSPLLAIAAWFILFQGGNTSDYTLAAISIATGLLVKNIIETLEAFGRQNLRKDSSKSAGITQDNDK
jgi:hypothetical protein